MMMTNKRAKSWLRRVSVFSAVTLVLVSFYFAETNGIFRVQQVQLSVDGANSQYWQDQFKNLVMSFDRFKKKNIWSISFKEMHSLLSRSSWVESYTVKRRLPNNILVRVVPKPIMAVLVTRKGEVTPLSFTGELLPKTKLTRSPVAPIVRDRILFQSEERREQLVKLLREIPYEGEFGLKTIDEIEKRGETIWFRLVKNRIDVRIGEGSVPIKVARVNKVLEYLKSQKITDRVIDAEFTEKVVVRPRKRP